MKTYTCRACNAPIQFGKCIAKKCTCWKWNEIELPKRRSTFKSLHSEAENVIAEKMKKWLII